VTEDTVKYFSRMQLKDGLVKYIRDVHRIKLKPKCIYTSGLKCHWKLGCAYGTKEFHNVLSAREILFIMTSSASQLTKGTLRAIVLCDVGNGRVEILLLWPPYGIKQAIIFLPCGFFYLLSFFRRPISAVADWMSAIILRMMWP